MNIIRKNIEVVKDTRYYTASRLPVDIVPEHYNVTLAPDLEEFTFNGKVEIIFSKTENEVTRIILNANELDIKSGHVETMDGSRMNLKKIIHNIENETIALMFTEQKFTPKSLTLEFTGTLNDKMKGFYRSSFKIADRTVYAATTQFEACEARRAFPCFDEPAIRATYDVTLIYDGQPIIIGDNSYPQIALSNTNMISDEPASDGKKVAKFERTPKMSAYLVAFVVGPWEFIEAATSEKKWRVRVYTTPGKTEQGRFALDVATKALAYYEDYFGIEYPLTKLDLIAVPDFAMGAMENWGLVTYRETTLLYDPKATSTAAKQYVALVIAHELAHMWFGNLVAIAWWNELWLKEGFATFMQYLCTDKIFPEWNLWSQFVSDVWSGAMHKDSLHNSHPIEVPVNRACEIDDIFDDISYEKGCSVIRMLYDCIGDDFFRVGMNAYLTKFSYSNATTNDLWNCLGEACNKPIAQMMSAWTLRMGHPWVRVHASNDCEDMTITLEQERFTANGKLDENQKKELWMVPISLVSGSGHVEPIKDILGDKAKTFVIPKQGNNWLKINKDCIGFYRTAYQPAQLEALINVIQAHLKLKQSDADSTSGVLTDVDRYGIQNDYFALCQAGHVQTLDLFKLLASFEDETDLIVWRSIDYSVFWLCNLFRDTTCPYKAPFNSFATKLYQKIYTKLTWNPKDGENDTDSMLRAIIISRLVTLGHRGVVEEAIKLFNAHIKREKMITPDLRLAVYTAVAKFGSDSQYNDLFTLRRHEEAPEEKNRIARALSSTDDPDRVGRVIDMMLTDQVRIQDKFYVIISIARSNPSLAWSLFKDHHEYFKQIYETSRNMSSLIEYSSQYFISEERAQEVEQFFKNNKFEGADRIIEQSLETIRLNSAWLDRLKQENSDNINQFLLQFAKN